MNEIIKALDSICFILTDSVKEFWVLFTALFVMIIIYFFVLTNPKSRNRQG